MSIEYHAAEIKKNRPAATSSDGALSFLRAMRAVGDDDALDGPRDVIPGIIAERQTAICPGAPGTGKSFVFLDWLGRISGGLNFIGKPVMRGGAIYVTGEGQAGMAKRISALASQIELTADSTFLYVTTMPHLLDPRQVADFIEALKLRTAKWKEPIRLIAFDTFNRAIVGGSENEGKDVARLLDADNRIKAAFDCATIFAHHPGKSEGNDMRGHSSLLGDIDVTCLFAGRNGTRTIEVKKQKDEAGGGLFGYSLRQISLGFHKQSGEPVTSCLVDWVDGATARNVRASKVTWPRGVNFIRDVVTTALLENGQEHQPGGDGPKLRAVPVNAARDLHRRRYVNAGDGDRGEAERKAWKRNLTIARDNGLLAGEMVDGVELIWLTEKIT
jgi:hypothetical protein